MAAGVFFSPGALTTAVNRVALSRQPRFISTLRLLPTPAESRLSTGMATRSAWQPMDSAASRTNRLHGAGRASTGKVGASGNLSIAVLSVLSDALLSSILNVFRDR